MEDLAIPSKVLLDSFRFLPLLYHDDPYSVSDPFPSQIHKALFAIASNSSLPPVILPSESITFAFVTLWTFLILSR